MEPIRYTSRICTEQERIIKFLQDQRVGILSMVDREERPYGVPVNYVLLDGNIYFHGMGTGRKNDILASQPVVSFCVFEEYGTIFDTIPAKCDTAYLSVVLTGSVHPVEALTVKTRALQEIVEKFAPDYFKEPLAERFVKEYTSSLDRLPVAIYCLEVEQISAKESRMNLA